MSKDNTLIKGTEIIRRLKTSIGHKLTHNVIAREISVGENVATSGKMNTDEPVTGLLREILHPGGVTNLPDLNHALGGLLGGAVSVAGVNTVVHGSGLDIGGLTC